jgi:hypothetical protein
MGGMISTSEKNGCHYRFWKNNKEAHKAAELAKKEFLAVIDLRTVRPMVMTLF